jgi:acyl carrier protein
MTIPHPARARVLTLMSTALALPEDLLDSGQSFQGLGVDSVAVVDALFTLEENLGITIDFSVAGIDASEMDGQVRDLIDRIAGMIPAGPGFAR